MEVRMGEGIDVYRELYFFSFSDFLIKGGLMMENRYYEGGVSSVYFWDLDDGFAGVVLLKKSTNEILSTRRVLKTFF